MPYLPILSQKPEEKQMLPAVFCKAGVTLIPKPDTCCKKRKPQTRVPHDYRCENSKDDSGKSNAAVCKKDGAA